MAKHRPNPFRWLMPFFVALLTGAAQAQEVDLELVLAVDVSRSMDIDEQELQRQGYVAGFRHPDVLRAIADGMTGRIGVTYVEWAGPGSRYVIAPWTVIDGPASAEAFAAALSGAPIQRLHGTSISDGLAFAAERFADSPFTSPRRVIDISGDGPNNMGGPVLPARDAVLAKGIVINGLPIMIKAADSLYSIRDLDRYYAGCVIGGPGAFIIPVQSIQEIAEAIRRKLVLEIASARPRLMFAAESMNAEPADCLIGERLRRMWIYQ
ncbi:DUF1194 domain-containing protein [Propylenella binzhouense]|uniref:DUF1194 domain-containing protein n=1 Tax=Propylenella binzhouense TaxID=2555902 RepID=A0A964T740_9HYPH|nr:DUF1194 domain-containing protein [Propylenella binzhouense]MYZ49049.1 DUF1194 domain-containing protein [Propylenella binzhouense]